MMTFAAAFIMGASLIFGIASLVGTAVEVAGLPFEWRVTIAAAGLVTLALVDIFAIKKGRYCPLSWRRQTPKTLGRRYAVTAVAAAWGFDTGLAVTTFRVAALTWGALVMTGLGLSSWWVGFGYGLGFVLPLIVLLLTQTHATGSNAQKSLGLRVEGLLGKRTLVQFGSAFMLFIAGAVLLIRLFE
jgi:hypothetical protein